MASDPRDNPAEKIRLPKRLGEDISKLRTRGFGEPRITDLTELVRIASAYAPDLSSSFERVEKTIEDAITRLWGDKKFAEAIRVAYGAEGTTAGRKPKERYAAAYEIYRVNSLSNFTTRVLPQVDKDLGKQIAAFYFDGEIAEEQTPPPPPPPPHSFEAIPPVVDIQADPPRLPPRDDSSELSDVDHKPSPKAETVRPSRGYIIRTEDPKAPRAQYRPLRPPRKARLTRGIIFGCAALILGWGLFVAVKRKGTGGQDDSVPKPRTVTSAETGKQVEHPRVKAASKSDEPIIGVMKLCDLSDKSECATPIDAVYYTETKPFVAKIGDVIEARFSLYSNGPKPLPFFRLEVNASRFEGQSHAQIELRERIIWQGSEEEKMFYSPPPPMNYVAEHLSPNFQMIEAKGAGKLTTKYVPGSTKLLDSRGRLFARLPDGLMDQRGVYLTDLGAPANCLCQGGNFFREVSFRFKLIDEM